MGGAFTGQADDLTAIQHNPAGLSQLRGVHLLVDVQGLNHDVTFRRRDVDPQTGDFDDRIQTEEVRNAGGLFMLPFIALGYGTELAGRRFHASVGVYGPPSVGRYQFPEPNYEKNERGNFAENPIKFAPQRYGLISNDIIILYPTLAASYEVHRTFSVGVSLQYVYSQFTFRQAVTSALTTPDSQAREDANYDSLVTVDQVGAPAVTGILGVQFRPTEFLQVGVSYRPPVPISAEGTAVIELGEVPAQLATIEGDRASFDLTLPQELKVGVHVRPLPGLGINADLVYQGWQTVDEFVLTPEDIRLSLGGAEPEPLAPIHIPKHWHHSFSGRLGAQYRFSFGLTARAGVLFEQGAIPDENLHIDFLHVTRTFVTAGAEYEAGPIDVVLSGAWLPTQTKDVRTSEVRQANTDPAVAGSVIGNGTYRSGGWIVGLGLRAHFGGGGPESAVP